MGHELLEAQKRGELLLDERFPGWHNKVNPATLDMGSDNSCVLAQAFFSNFWDVRDSLFADADSAVAQACYYGFDARDQEDESFDALTDLWRQAIHARRLMEQIKAEMPEVQVAVV